MERAFERLDRELSALEQLMDDSRDRPQAAPRQPDPAPAGQRGTPELRRLAGELQRLAHDLSATVAALPQARRNTEDRRGSPDRPAPGEAGPS